MERTWAVIQLRGGIELATIERLREDLGLRCYCPRAVYLTKPKNKSKPVRVEKAALPGYGFADLACGVAAHDIIDTDGVRGIVKLGGDVAYMSEDQVDIMRDYEARGFFNPVDGRDPTQFVGIGDQVIVNAGPFAGIVGKVISILNRAGDKIIVKNQSFRVPIQISICHVAKIGA